VNGLDGEIAVRVVGLRLSEFRGDRHRSAVCRWIARLIAWTRLERRPTGRWFDSSSHESNLAAIAEAQSAGILVEGDPVDLLVLVIGMASAWSPSSSV
jgi:hypothetical protein